jgi:hypothetical protein
MFCGDQVANQNSSIKITIPTTLKGGRPCPMKFEVFTLYGHGCIMTIITADLCDKHGKNL